VAGLSDALVVFDEGLACERTIQRQCSLHQAREYPEASMAFDETSSGDLWSPETVWGSGVNTSVKAIFA
jgi:hypothetical protein